MAFRSATRSRCSASCSRRFSKVEPGPGSITAEKLSERISALAMHRGSPVQFRSSKAEATIGNKVYRRALGEGPTPAFHTQCGTLFRFRKCLQNDELMEYASYRSSLFHSATQLFVSRTGVKPPPSFRKQVVCCFPSRVPIQP